MKLAVAIILSEVLVSYITDSVNSIVFKVAFSIHDTRPEFVREFWQMAWSVCPLQGKWCSNTLGIESQEEERTVHWVNELVVATLIGIGSNLDNSGVGLAYGTEKIRFPHRINGIVNSVGLMIAWLGASLGTAISKVISPSVSTFASALVLCGIGGFILYSAYIRPRISDRPEQAKLETPSVRQGFLLGVALSVSNLASGFGATVTNSSAIWLTVGSITLWGYFMIWFGNILGIGILAKILGKYSSVVAGLLLIAVGVHQVY
jgi:putative Mn2+ efflux pump MntP